MEVRGVQPAHQARSVGKRRNRGRIYVPPPPTLCLPVQ